MALAGQLAFCTLAEVKQALKIPTADTTNDAALEVMIVAASERIESYCNRSFARKVDGIEKLVGAGWPKLLPDRTPIESIKSVSLTGTLLDVTQFEIIGKQRSMIEWLNGSFPWDARLSGDGIAQSKVPGTESRNVTLVFTGGYWLPNDTSPGPDAFPLPLTIRVACAALCADMWRRDTRDASIAAEAVGEASVTLAVTTNATDAMAAALPPYVKSLLSAYYRAV